MRATTLAVALLFAVAPAWAGGTSDRREAARAPSSSPGTAAAPTPTAGKPAVPSPDKVSVPPAPPGPEARARPVAPVGRNPPASRRAYAAAVRPGVTAPLGAVKREVVERKPTPSLTPASVAAVGPRAVAPAPPAQLVPAALPPMRVPAAACSAAERLPSPREESLPFAPGEWLRYRLSVKGVEAGVLELEAHGWRTHEGRRVFALEARGGTNSFFSSFQRSRGRQLSRLGVVGADGGLASTGFLREVRIGALPVSEAVSLGGGAGGRYVFERGEPDVLHETREFAEPGPLDDIVSAIYHLRAVDLVEGQPLCLDVFGQRRNWHITGTVGGTEGVFTPAGWYRARIVDGVAVRQEGAPGQARFEIRIWLSDDAARLPVQMRTYIPQGEVLAALDRVKVPRLARR